MPIQSISTELPLPNTEAEDSTEGAEGATLSCLAGEPVSGEESASLLVDGGIATSPGVGSKRGVGVEGAAAEGAAAAAAAAAGSSCKA
jgi:hypothetical protein